MGEIINNQRQSSESFGLGFEQDNDDKDSTSITPNHEAGTRSFANALKSLVKEKDDRKNDQQFAYVNKGVAPYRRPLTTKYQTIFLWHCYFCYNFGHKAANCKALANNNFEKNRSPLKNIKAGNMNKETINSNEAINSFILLEIDIKWYQCHNHVNLETTKTSHKLSTIMKPKVTSTRNTIQRLGRKRPKNKKNANCPCIMIIDTLLMKFINT